MSSHSTPSTVRLSDYWVLLRRGWAAIVICGALGLMAAGLYLFMAPREYTAVTSVLVTAPTPVSTQPAGKAADINLDTEARLVTSTATVLDAAAQLDLPQGGIDDLGNRVTVTVPPNTDILTISFVAPTADEAQEGARAFAEAYLQARKNSTEESLEAEFDALQSRIDQVSERVRLVTEAVRALPEGSLDRASRSAEASSLSNQLTSLGVQQNEVRAAAILPGRVVTEAELPSSPSSPDVALVLLAGGLLGLLLGVGVAALHYRSDDRIRTAADLQRRSRASAVATLAAPLRERELTVVAPSSPDGRTYARLRNLILAELGQGPSRNVVLVAGIHRGGGSVAANLATSLARAGEDVCLVCADVFAGTAEALLGVRRTTGLADVLDGRRTAEDVVVRAGNLPTLRVLGAGSDPDRTEALLQTRGFRDLVDQLLGSVSYVVVEAPATQDGTGAQTLAGAAEHTLLVVETGQTTAREVTDALDQFESMRRPVLGAVLARYEAAAPAPDLRAVAPRRPEAADDTVVPPVGSGVARR